MELIVDVDEETYTLLSDHLHLSPGLFLEFLTVFSRAEYALKTAKYHEQAPHVTPSWDRFANHINTDFRLITDTEFLEAVNYLMTNPPGKQVIEDGELRFRPTDVDPDQTRAQQVLGLVRRVRNNLFHGGKFVTAEQDNNHRNHRLIEASLTVLKRCLTLDPEVHSRYER